MMLRTAQHQGRHRQGVCYDTLLCKSTSSGISTGAQLLPQPRAPRRILQLQGARCMHCLAGGYSLSLSPASAALTILGLQLEPQGILVSVVQLIQLGQAQIQVCARCIHLCTQHMPSNTKQCHRGMWLMAY